MGGITRRTALWAIGAGVLAASTTARAGAAPVGGSAPLARSAAPPGVLTQLPGAGTQLALTVDDGTNTAVVAAFIQFCRDTGTRLTFFPNGDNPSWTANAPALRPMVDVGQIQLGNHTWSHPCLNRISLSEVADQIRRNADFLRNTYGTDGTPFFRPPYGVHNADIDRVAADQGYPTVTLWSSDVGDSLPETAGSLIANARNAFQPQQIVLIHANLPTITQCFPQLSGIIAARALQTVTLNDVFGQV